MDFKTQEFNFILTPREHINFINKHKYKPMIQQKKYFKNLEFNDKYIFSYNTNVATIDHDKRQVIIKHWYSVTTSKHINYIANLLNYQTIKLY